MTVRVLLPLLLMTACDPDNELSRLPGHDTFEQAPSNMVDILWVIDNSVSMLNEQEAVSLGAEDFVANLESTEMDFHLGVMTTDVDRSNPTAGVLLGEPQVLTSQTTNYADAFRSRVQQGNTGSDQESGLEAALMAISSPLAVTANEGFLRDGAMLSIIVLSDENDCSDAGALGADSTGEDCYLRSGELTPVTDLVRSLVAVKGEDDVVLSGIIGPEIVDGCDATVPGRRYYTAIELLRGAKADICSTDYSSIMDKLGQVASGILTVFQLSHSAVDDGTIEVTVTPEGGETITPPRDDTGVNGWTYHAEYAQIEFFGDAIPPRAATIDVTYSIAGAVESTGPSDTGS